MEVSKINFKQTFKAVHQGLQNLGQQAGGFIKKADEGADRFIKDTLNANPKTVKQVGLGAVVGVAGLALVVSCVKGIVNSIKDEIKEK